MPFAPMQDLGFREVFVVHGPTLGDLLPFWILAGAAVAFAAARLNRRFHDSMRPGSRLAVRIGAYLLPALALLVGGQIIQEFRAAKDQYQRGNFSVVLGNVTGFTPGSESEHRDESFYVGPQEFRYSPSVISPYFHQTAENGGPIRPGLAVRICHTRGDILRLEIIP